MKGSAARSAIDDLDFSENRSRPLVMNRCVIQVLPCVYLCQTTSSQFIGQSPRPGAETSPLHLQLTPDKHLKIFSGVLL